jgi:2-phosphosulfolactate phosphatase
MLCTESGVQSATRLKPQASNASSLKPHQASPPSALHGGYFVLYHAVFPAARRRMPQEIHVHQLPELVTADQLAGAAVVVIDVLRASTTIAHALDAGADCVIPCLEVDEARQLANQLEGLVVLGGERQGLKIDGFDLGNSPTDYTPDSVGGRTVVFTTTNGTKAMMRCRRAKRVLVGCFANYSAICRALRPESVVHLLCAGTDGAITREDVLAAGMMVVELCCEDDDPPRLNDQAELAADAFRTVTEDLIAGVRLASVLAECEGGRNLIARGLGRDIETAAQIDSLGVVPELDLIEWRIEAAG